MENLIKLLEEIYLAPNVYEVLYYKERRQIDIDEIESILFYAKKIADELEKSYKTTLENPLI